MSFDLVVLVGLSMMMNIACLLKIWFVSWKSLRVNMASGFLTSLRWLIPFPKLSKTIVSGKDTSSVQKMNMYIYIYVKAHKYICRKTDNLHTLYLPPPTCSLLDLLSSWALFGSLVPTICTTNASCPEVYDLSWVHWWIGNNREVTLLAFSLAPYVY